MRLVVALVALLAVVPALHAENVQGYIQAGDLDRACSPNGDAQACSTYTVGVVDTANSMSAAFGIPAMFCVPDGTDRDELGQVVGRFLNEHPEKWQYGGVDAVIQALRGAYPCTASRTTAITLDGGSEH